MTMRTFNDIVPPSRRKEMGLPHKPRHRWMVRLIDRRSTSLPRAVRVPIYHTRLVLIVIIVSIGALFYFSKAEVDVTPELRLSGDSELLHGFEQLSTLPFQIITAQKIASQSVASSGTKTVNSQRPAASPSITLKQSPDARCQHALRDGIWPRFRIHSAVTIPGEVPPHRVAPRQRFMPTRTVVPTTLAQLIHHPRLLGYSTGNRGLRAIDYCNDGGRLGHVPVVDPTLDAQTRTALDAALAPDCSRVSSHKSRREMYLYRALR